LAENAPSSKAIKAAGKRKDIFIKKNEVEKAMIESFENSKNYIVKNYWGDSAAA
jgi:hypothetical protein